MEKANAQEFYEVYRGVVQEYSAMVDELSLGPCIAMEIRAQNAPATFREMAGPADPVSECMSSVLMFMSFFLVTDSVTFKYMH